MGIEPTTISAKVLLVNGEEAEVRLLKYLPFRKKQQIISKLTSGMKIKQGQSMKDIDIDAAQGMLIFGDLAEAIWADKNITIDDVEGDSLYKVLTERFNTFLGSLGFESEVRDKQGSGTEEDQQPSDSAS